jgi:hypothetical protein
VYVVVIDAALIDRFSKVRMSIIDDILKEKQRVGEALARIDAQREKLASELAELEATERVLARYGKDTRVKKTSSVHVSATQAAAPAQPPRRLPATAAKSAGNKRAAPTLGDRVLALATGKTRQEITAACQGARPNHVGVLIARHKRAGRIEERDGKLYATHSTATEQGTAV